MLTRLAPWAIAGLTLTLGLLIPWLETPLVTAISYGFAALGVSFLVRAGQVSFGHAGFTCLSGYAVVAISRTWPQVDGLLLLVVSALTGGAAGALVGLFMRRWRLDLKGAYRHLGYR